MKITQIRNATLIIEYAGKGTRTPLKYRFDKDNYDRLKSNGFQLEFYRSQFYDTAHRNVGGFVFA